MKQTNNKIRKINGDDYHYLTSRFAFRFDGELYLFKPLVTYRRAYRFCLALSKLISCPVFLYNMNYYNELFRVRTINYKTSKSKRVKQ